MIVWFFIDLFNFFLEYGILEYYFFQADQNKEVKELIVVPQPPRY